MKLKKTIAVLSAIIMAFQFSSCVNGNEVNVDELSNVLTDEEITEKADENNETTGETTTKKSSIFSNDDMHIPVSVKASPDKYTWYIKDYVGKNCASIGYYSLGEERLDSYGSGHIKLIFISEDHSYIDIENDEALKNYVVTGQSLEPNTELKFSFMTNSEGKEYDNLISVQSYDEIVLSVKKVGTTDNNPISLTKIKPSPDKYTRYISDYVGRNVANCGYTSLGGNRNDHYGDGYIKLNLITSDGSFIDVEDEETLKAYYVIGQSIEPNTEIRFEFMKNSDGEEYDNLIDTQSIEEIDLYVTRNENESKSVSKSEIPESPTTELQLTESSEKKEKNTSTSDGIRPEFKEALDSYEAFFDEYCDIMKKYIENPLDMSILMEYYEYIEKAEEMDEKLEALDDGEMSDEELAYYLEVTARITTKMLEIYK